MAIEFLRKTLAGKISDLLDIEVPLMTKSPKEVKKNSAKLNFDGMHIEEEKLQQCYNFTFSFFSDDKDAAEDKINKVSEMMRTSFPEIISDGENKFCMRYVNVRNSSTKTYDSPGIFLYVSELTFSIIM